MTPSLPWYRLCAAFGHGADAEGTHASRKRGKQCANTSKRPNCCMFLSCPEMYRLLPPVRHDPGYRSAAKPMYTYITLHTTPRHRACATGTHLAGHTRGRIAGEVLTYGEDSIWINTFQLSHNILWVIKFPKAVQKLFLCIFKVEECTTVSCQHSNPRARPHAVHVERVHAARC